MCVSDSKTLIQQMYTSGCVTVQRTAQTHFDTRSHQICYPSWEKAKLANGCQQQQQQQKNGWIQTDSRVEVCFCASLVPSEPPPPTCWLPPSDLFLVLSTLHRFTYLASKKERKKAKRRKCLSFGENGCQQRLKRSKSSSSTIANK